MDIRLGQTKEEDIDFPLRWGIISASANLTLVQADYPDRVYALDPAVTGFGAQEMPVIAAAGRRVEPQPYADDAYSAHGASPSAAVLQYTEQEGTAVITFPNGRFVEETHYIGTNGRITIETPSHHPSALTVRTGRPPRDGTREAEGKPAMELDPSEGWVGDWRETHWNPDRNPTNGAFNHVERFNYSLPTPAPITRGQPAGSRWTGEKLIRYKGWTWSGGNQHGFMYQAQAVHRCMRQLPGVVRDLQGFGDHHVLEHDEIVNVYAAPWRGDPRADLRGAGRVVGPRHQSRPLHDGNTRAQRHEGAESAAGRVSTPSGPANRRHCPPRGS